MLTHVGTIDAVGDSDQLLRSEVAMTEPNLLARIESNPKVLGGKPVIRGTRIAVSLILKFIAAGMTADEIIEEYPHLSAEDIRAALFFAERVTEGEGLLSEVTPG